MLYHMFPPLHSFSLLFSISINPYIFSNKFYIILYITTPILIKILLIILFINIHNLKFPIQRRNFNFTLILIPIEDLLMWILLEQVLELSSLLAVTALWQTRTLILSITQDNTEEAPMWYCPYRKSHTPSKVYYLNLQ